MGIFSKLKVEKELALVLDIGSSSIGGAIFEVHKNSIPKIILSVREPIIFEEKINLDRFLSLTLKTLDTVTNKICMSGAGKPSKVYCVLSSPWYASQTRTIRLEKNALFQFTTKIADDLIQKEINFFEEEHIKKFLNTDKASQLIELKNMKIMLNGYPTVNPFEKKAKKLEMIVFLSMSSKQILSKISEIIFRHFHTKDVKFSSFVMASFAVTRDVFVNQDDFLLVDIGGEVTDISIVKKDILGDSISYPLGRNFMIRKVAENLNTSLSEARSFISLYKNEHATKLTHKKLEEVMSKLKNEWLSEFQKSLVAISTDVSIPSTIFITVDPDLVEFFSKIIKMEQFSQHTFTDSEFKIIFLGVGAFHGFASFEENITRDPSLIIETIYLNRFIC